MFKSAQIKPGYKEPLFVRFINGDTGLMEMLDSFSQSKDPYTLQAVEKARVNTPDISDFKKELKEAVLDIVKEGIDDTFKVFVDHYMGGALEEDIKSSKDPLGDNVQRVVRVINDEAPWIQALICYNLSLYIRTFGLESLKSCKVCNKLFSNKGQYAAYCSDSCKKQSKIAPKV